MSSDINLFEDANSGRHGICTEYEAIAAPTHPDAAKALAFWQARPADGIIIGRDLPSRAIASLLSHVIVHEPIDGGNDLKVRLAGTAVRRRFGRDITGCTLSELFPTDSFTYRLRSVMMAIETGEPQYADCQISNGNLDLLHSQLLILPVLSADRANKWAMTVVFFFN